MSHSNSLLLKEWSLDQRHGPRQGTCDRRRVLGPAQTCTVGFHLLTSLRSAVLPHPGCFFPGQGVCQTDTTHIVRRQIRTHMPESHGQPSASYTGGLAVSCTPWEAKPLPSSTVLSFSLYLPCPPHCTRDALAALLILPPPAVQIHPTLTAWSSPWPEISRLMHPSLVVSLYFPPVPGTPSPSFADLCSHNLIPLTPCKTPLLFQSLVSFKTG